MTMRVRLLLCMLGCCTLLSGCAAGGGTTDPRKGGLFSYNPKAYERRIQEREARVDASSGEAKAARDEQAQLQASVTEQENRKAEAQKQMSAMNAELAKTRRALDAAKTQDARAQASLGELRRRHTELSGQLGRLDKNPDHPGAQAERERLDVEIRRLKQEAEALSAL
jgi:septal ring factor EnvC (AmiA/AmiB activator)